MIYEVEFKIGSPVVTNTEIHFDGIMCAVSPASHNKHMQVNRFTKAEDIITLPIPVDCIKIGKSYIYCCSSADYVNGTPIVDKSVKRKGGLDFLYYNQRQYINSTINKNCMLTLYCIACESIKFLVSSSNFKELDRYCRRVHNIGGMRKQGYGEVLGYNISEMPELNWQDCIITPDNIAIRNIPQEFCENTCNSELRCKPPYWLLDGKQQCSAVGEQAMLKDDIFLNEFKRGNKE